MSVVLTPADHTLDPELSRELISHGSFSIDLSIMFDANDEGVLVAHGDQGGGYVLYVEADTLFVIYNDGAHEARLSCGKLLEGETTIVLTFAVSPNGTCGIAVSVNDVQRGSLGPLEMLGPFMPLEGIDVGIDRRSPVSWNLYERHGCFPYCGGLTSVRYVPLSSANLQQSSPVRVDEAVLKYD